MNDYLRAFFRSPLAIGVVSGTTILAVAAALTGLIPIPIVIPLYTAVTATAIAIILSSKTGARAILEEQDRARSERDAMILEEISQTRKRLSMVRIENEAVRCDIEKIVLAAGMYLESCAEGNPRDPFVEEAVRNAENAVRTCLRLSDARAVHQMITEDRHSSKLSGNAAGSVPGNAPEPGILASLTDSLQKIAREIGERLALPEGGIEDSHTRLDQMNAHRELEE